MPRVTYVKKARKDNPVAKAGESYYWWKFRYGGKRYSKTKPRRSQLTQSAYFGTLYDLEDSIQEASITTEDEFTDLVESTRSSLEDLQSETQDSLDNMPDALQYSPTGELLQERIDALDCATGELDYVDEFDFEEEDFDDSGYDEDDPDDTDAMADDKRDHELDEATRREEEFNAWADEAKETIASAVADAIV